MTRDYRLVWAAFAVLAGVALFGGAVLRLGLGAGGGWDPRGGWLLTPIFLAPLLGYLVWARRLGVWTALLLTAWITAAHLIAIAIASNVYKPPPDDGLWHVLDDHARQVAYEARWRIAHAAAAASALRGGLEAGAAGAVLSLVVLPPIAPAFRRPAALAAMAVGVVALTGLGGLGLSHRMPDAMTPTDYALWVFGPWQLVFGLLLAWLFRGKPARA